MFSFRRLIALVGIAALLLAALAPAPLALLWALVVPLVLFSLFVVAPLRREPVRLAVPASNFASPLAARAPPVR